MDLGMFVLNPSFRLVFHMSVSPGHGTKSLIRGYPLSFLREGFHSNKQQSFRDGGNCAKLGVQKHLSINSRYKTYSRSMCIEAQQYSLICFQRDIYKQAGGSQKGTRLLAIERLLRYDTWLWIKGHISWVSAPCFAHYQSDMTKNP